MTVMARGPSIEEIRRTVDGDESRIVDVLRDGVESAAAGLDRFQGWVETSLGDAGCAVERFALDPSDVLEQPAYNRTARTEPDRLRAGPNVVATLSGDGTGRSRLFFAHADTAPTVSDLVDDGGSFREGDDRYLAPGIADDISGVTAIVSAVDIVDRSEFRVSNDVLVGSVLGKQFGVMGTYGLARDYGPTDDAVYVHPAETEAGLDELKVGSNGICEFEIRIDGTPPDTSESVHTLFAGSGTNPIAEAARLYRGLLEWAERASTRYGNPRVERIADESVSVMLGEFVSEASGEIYTIPDRCTIRGTVCFPPNVDLDTIAGEVEQAVKATRSDGDGRSGEGIEFEWGDLIAESATTDEDSPIVRDGRSAVAGITGRRPSLYHGHTASDIRYPVLYWGADSFGFGPKAGGMGTPDEWIDASEYLDTVTAIVSMICDSPESP